MSTVTVQTISNGTVSTSSANVIQGSAKAWVQFAGATGTISGSFNVSSVTRSNTGRYVINMTNALADTNYAVTGASSPASGSWPLFALDTTGGYGATSRTTSSFNLGILSEGGGSFVDGVRINVAVFR